MSLLARPGRLGAGVFLGAATSVLVGWAVSAQAENPPQVLRIGTTGTLGGGHTPAEQKAAENLLKSFVKDETGLTNEVVEEKDWQTLGEQLNKGTVHLGAFRGYEYAWAKQRYPALRPLVLAVRGSTYPILYVVTRKDEKVRTFADLRGQSVVLLGGGIGALDHIFLEREVQTLNQSTKTFFSRIVTKKNAEDLIDDVVDGTEQAGVVERASLEAYKRRKPGRFNQLKEIAKSPAVLPGVLAYAENQLGTSTLGRFRKGLISANQKERGQTLLTMFHLTGFEAVPTDFQQVLIQTQKTFPAPAAK